MILRSLRIKQPYRGRTLRTILRYKIPGGDLLLDYFYKQKSLRVSNSGAKALRAGKKEGRRFLTAIPHPFCGIGHGLAEWHTAFQWARLLDLEFLHIPLKENWDSFLGLSKLPTFEKTVKNLPHTVIRVPYAKGWSSGKDVYPEVKQFIDSIRSDKNLLFVLADSQNVHDHISHAAPFRKLFEENGSWQGLPLYRDKDKYNIAVHMRRGDIMPMVTSKSRGWEARYLSEEWFNSVMDAVLVSEKEKPVCFHIYSQGQLNDFPLMSAREDVCFHLDASEEETLFNLIKADILIMSPSGFSYLAAMLSRGLKIARYPWWHEIPNKPNWIRIEGEEVRLASKLRNFLTNSERL